MLRGYLIFIKKEEKRNYLKRIYEVWRKRVVFSKIYVYVLEMYLDIEYF